MEKAVITKDQADALDHWLKTYVGGEETLLKQHACDGFWTGEQEALNGIPIKTIAQALFNGYEIEPTPEDKIADFYNNPEFNNAWVARMAIKKVLNILGKDVKGVNC